MKVVMIFKNIFRKNFNSNENVVHLISLSCNTVPPAKYGGIELVVANLAKGLSELGMKVRVYSPGELGVEGVQHSQTLLTPSPSIIGEHPVPSNTVEHLEVLQQEITRHYNSGDAIIFNHSDQFRYLKKKFGRLFWLKANTYEIAHWLDVGLYDNIIYPSLSLMKDIRKPGFVISHGEELVFNKPFAPTSRDLFYAGRITQDKGVHIALEACKRIGCKLIIAAPSSDSEYFNSIVKSPEVEYLGELNAEQLLAQYEKTYAFIYMTQYNEPFGLAVIEAMAAGTPVITTGYGGTGETVIENETGFFCDTVEAIVEAYARTPSLDRCKIQAHAKNYTYRKMAEKYKSLIVDGAIGAQ